MHPRASAYQAASWTDLLGYDQDELPPSDRFLDWFFERVDPKDRRPLQRAHHDFITGKVENYSVEVRLRPRSGHSIRVCAISEAVERNEDHSVRRMVGVLIDISEQKGVEQALRESEERFRLAVRNVPLVLAQADHELRYRWIHNPHPDFDSAAVIGRRDDELENAEGARRLTGVKRRVLQSGQGAREEIQFVRKEGIRTYDISVEPLRDSTGSVVGVTSAGLDVTERKQAEKTLRQRDRLLALTKGQEEERRRIASALHDDLVQRLALLEINLDTLAANSPPEHNLAARVQPLKDEIARLCEDTRRISHQLHPAMLEVLGLKAALEAECARHSNRHDILVQCHVDVPANLSGDVKLALYRIVQEGLNNIFKHARASRVNVATKVLDGELLLRLEDDGIGFDSEQVPAGGLGILSMQESVSRVNGAISIQSQPGKGTSLDVTVPLRPDAPPLVRESQFGLEVEGRSHVGPGHGTLCNAKKG